MIKNQEHTINSGSWLWYAIDELFEIKKGKRLTKANMKSGSIPFIGSIDSNNGVSSYIGQHPIHSGNTISVNYNGSVGEAFYQPIPFWASDDVNVLYPRFTLSKYSALFIITVIRKEKYRFNYGRKWHMERMKSSRIKLPAMENGEVDTAFMENFVKKLPNAGLLDAKNKHPMPKNFKPIINTSSWLWFEYRELFDIERGRGPRKKDLDGTGKTPFVTSTENNNGWISFTNMAAIHEENTIGVNRNGSVGEAFYQPIPFCSTEDVHIFKPKFKLNKYIAFFLCALIRKEKYRFNYGRKWGIARMLDSKIKLPATPTGKPDWDYMTNFIKELPFGNMV